MGYTHIDTASFYKNEHYISNTLKKLGVGGIGGNPVGPGGQLGLSREDLFITSKVCTVNLLYLIFYFRNTRSLRRYNVSILFLLLLL